MNYKICFFTTIDAENSDIALDIARSAKSLLETNFTNSVYYELEVKDEKIDDRQTSIT